MAAVHIRRLDDDVVARLKSRAARNNRSLEGELRHILEQAAGGDQDDVADKRRRFDENIRKVHAEIDWGDRPPQTPSEILIREDRDRRAGLIE